MPKTHVQAGGDFDSAYAGISGRVQRRRGWLTTGVVHLRNELDDGRLVCQRPSQGWRLCEEKL